MKNLKKVLAVVLVATMMFALTACGAAGNNNSNNNNGGKKVKIGLITLHDENSTYDLNFIKAFKAACEATGAEPVIMSNVAENEECLNAAEDLVDDGCEVIFADSFGHESPLMEAAKEFPEVQFCHATGTNAHTAGLKNFHNAFASIYEGRYLAGIAAGLKLNEMIEAGTITADQCKMGYVGAFTYAEVISGYTSFYLGAKSVCPTVTMEVSFTGSWYDEALEKTAAETLIEDGCVLVSQHADSMGAPSACEAAGVPNVSYNGSTAASCPNTFIVSSYINWQPYFELIINAVANGTEIPVDYVGSIDDGSVCLTEIGSAAADGTAEAIEAAKGELKAGTLQVFNAATFTVSGAPLSSYLADVDSDANFEKDTEAIVDGAFAESKFRSAPYFDVMIDGISFKGDMAF